MKRMWVRLSIAFGLVAILVIIFFAAFLSLTFRSDVFNKGFVQDLTAQNGLIETLAQYYQTAGTWEGVNQVIRSEAPSFMPGVMGDMILAISDASDTVVYDPLDATNKPEFRPFEHIPIVIEGQTQGYLTLLRREPGPRQGPRPDQRITNVIILVAIIGILLGVLAGILVSHFLARPLNRLAQSVRQFGPHSLSHRVKEEGPTEVVQTARAFNEVISRLEEGENLRRNMVADIAHELRTPLTVLQSNLSALLQDVYELDKSEIARLYDQTRLLKRLVTDLHELSLADAHQLPLDVQPVDLTELARESAESFQALVELHNIQLEVHLPKEPAPIKADPARVHQIMSNLLMNALQHTPDNGKITLSLTRDDGIVQLSIQDTGDGIAPAHLPHVFDRFYRADPSRTRHGGGTGLGLAIVRALVQEQYGKVSASSPGEPGSGTLFTVVFPEQSPVPALA